MIAAAMADDQELLSERLQLVTSKTWIKEVDDWRREQAKLMSRSEAIRALVSRQLAAERRRKR